MLVCYVLGHVIKVGPSGLINAVLVLPLGGSRFLDLTRASDIGLDLPLFALRRGDLRLLSPPLGL